HLCRLRRRRARRLRPHRRARRLAEQACPTGDDSAPRRRLGSGPQLRRGGRGWGPGRAEHPRGRLGSGPQLRRGGRGWGPGRAEHHSRVARADRLSGELDLLVLGSGVAGLSSAVRAAAVTGLRVGVLTKAELSQAATRWAQGGVAAVLGGDPDSTDLHLADTLRAGVGLCDTDAVRVLVDEGPARVHELIALGAAFDRDPDGTLQLAREGGHSVARIVHAGGAATGLESERALVAAVRQ